MNFFKWLKKKEPKKTIINKEETKWFQCSSCGYRGTMEKFLKADGGDTICPRCGEDENIVFDL